jgi:hypothetical protein
MTHLHVLLQLLHSARPSRLLTLHLNALSGQLICRENSSAASAYAVAACCTFTLMASLPQQKVGPVCYCQPDSVMMTLACLSTVLAHNSACPAL